MRDLARTGGTVGTVAKYHNDVFTISSYSQSSVDWWRADGWFIVEELNRQMLRRQSVCQLAIIR